MSELSCAAGRIPFRAEVDARIRNRAQRLQQVQDCRERTLEALKSLKQVGASERLARTGWLKARCRRCRRCSLA